MKLTSIESIVRALNEADVPFIVVGGLAVVVHGYGRNTQDLDLVISMDSESIHAAFAALARLGYQPLVSITVDAFADQEQRQLWIKEKGMMVLNFHSDQHPDTPIDLFVAEPFDFNLEYKAAKVAALATGVPMRVLRLETLLGLKERTGRPQDAADVAELRRLHQGDADA